MRHLLTRRHLLALGAAFLATVAVRPLRAQTPASATSFVETFGSQVVAVVDAAGSLADKQRQIRPLIDSAVDVDAIATFCLGNAARTATPAQLRDYTQLFHGVLVNNIVSKVGQYRGVTFRLTTTMMRGADAYVGTIVQRPNEAAADVRWVVSNSSGAPKIIDVVAEGTSLRLTQRSDYASFLSHNNNNIDALLAAMRRQVGS